MRFPRSFVGFVLVGLLTVVSARVPAQLASRPAEEWIKTLDGPARVAGMKIDEIVAALKLQPGQTVADIGAGSGLLEVPLAKAVGPRGRVYAVEIDAGFFPEIKKRAEAAQVANVETVLGKFSDPALPAKNIDVAIFHDVMHHVENRAAYLKSLARYLAPSGRTSSSTTKAGRGPTASSPSCKSRASS